MKISYFWRLSTMLCYMVSHLLISTWHPMNFHNCHHITIESNWVICIIFRTETKSKKPNGIDAFESLPNTYYKTQAERLYRDLFEPEKFWYKEILLTAMFEVLFLSYGLYAYDLYLDIDLINAYQIQENNLRNLTLSTKNDSNFKEQSMEGV